MRQNILRSKMRYAGFCCFFSSDITVIDKSVFCKKVCLLYKQNKLSYVVLCRDCIAVMLGQAFTV